MDIRDRIKAVIEADPEKTVRSVSLAAGLSDSALHKFLTGATDSITLKTVDKLAESLGVDVVWLAYGEGDPDMAADVSRLLERIPADRRAEAMAILQVFARTGNRWLTRRCSFLHYMLDV
jgi:phage tail sheath gpL-like